ncbi:MAG: SGNH/GDSL hydrolase family protein [Abditibacteriota bacterium]|nr:SGNH/GDSL hydrolase family protein [Abditibacteriota bacterium]
MTLKKNMTILFEGDSITDAGRSREDDSFLGFGYATLVAAEMLCSYPEYGLKFINRSVSGNRTIDLVQRWAADAETIKPDVISIMIGINDTWRRYDSNDPTSTEAFEANYRDILVRSKKLTDDIIIIEPYLQLVQPGQENWLKDDLINKIGVCRKLACEFGTEYIPMQSIMADAAKLAAPSYWAADGVHPTWAGYALIADHYMDLFEG